MLYKSRICLVPVQRFLVSLKISKKRSTKRHEIYTMLEFCKIPYPVEQSVCSPRIFPGVQFYDPSIRPSFSFEHSEQHLLSVLEEERCSMAQEICVIQRKQWSHPRVIRAHPIATILFICKKAKVPISGKAYELQVLYMIRQQAFCFGLIQDTSK